MKFLIVFIIAMVALVNAQHFGSRFNSFQEPFSGFNFNGGFAQIRDPRANTGPVIFPPAPVDSGMTSGVVVGASGYGFVPPSNPGTKIGGLPFF